MSEFNSTKEKYAEDLFSFCMKILGGRHPSEAVKAGLSLLDKVQYKDVIRVVDELVRHNIPMNELKTGINKILNLFYKTLNAAILVPPEKHSFLWYLMQNNLEMEKRLKNIRPLIKDLNNEPQKVEIRKEVMKQFSGLEPFAHLYTIKENILFPVIEKHWDHYRCVQVMWSFHDDIRRNLKAILQILEGSGFDLKQFNSLSGSLFFNMLAIKFRDERILFPYLSETLIEKEMEAMLIESLEFEWPYIKPEKTIAGSKAQHTAKGQEKLNLLTGNLIPEEIRLIFNHLPLDITYVDEKDKVRYFSTPAHRIFPRSPAIIGRGVRNCHPPESVHIVEEIIESFRSGLKNKAEFWIKIKNTFVLISYFAVRDEKGAYKGVLEVTQEINAIQNITGEKRLLDWDIR